VPGALDGARGLINATGERMLIPDLAPLIAGLAHSDTRPSHAA
jgi:hypothetical protein